MRDLTPEPKSTISVSIIIDPAEIPPKVDGANCIKAMKLLLGPLSQSPWKCRFEINLPSGNLEMGWRRSGSTAGHVLWKWEGKTVAATLVLMGDDREDCFAIEHLIRTATAAELAISKSFVKRVRDSARPLVGIVLGVTDAVIRTPITEFSLGLSTGMCNQMKVKQSRPPVGTAMPQDFPPRFFHMVVANGVSAWRTWPDSKAFREIPNLQQVVATFMDRLEESAEKFDERILLRHDKGDSALRVQWSGHRPTAGMAELTDSQKGRHTLLLLSGKSAEDDKFVVDGFISGLPHFVGGLFEVVIREIRTAPRPMLLELIGFPFDKKKADVSGPAAEALAVAFFRRLGVF